MPNLKISELTSGNPAQSSDAIPIARSGANYQITASSIASLGSKEVFLLNQKSTATGQYIDIKGQSFWYDSTYKEFRVSIRWVLSYGTSPSTWAGDLLYFYGRSTSDGVNFTNSLLSDSYYYYNLLSQYGGNVSYGQTGGGFFTAYTNNTTTSSSAIALSIQTNQIMPYFTDTYNGSSIRESYEYTTDFIVTAPRNIYGAPFSGSNLITKGFTVKGDITTYVYYSGYYLVPSRNFFNGGYKNPGSRSSGNYRMYNLGGFQIQNPAYYASWEVNVFGVLA